MSIAIGNFTVAEGLSAIAIANEAIAPGTGITIGSIENQLGPLLLYGIIPSEFTSPLLILSLSAGILH